MTAEWTHFIDGRQIYPAGNWSIRVANASEDFDYCRDFRFKLEGDYILRGDDYDWLKTQTCYDELDFEIKCGGSTFWEGKATYPLDFDFDEDNCEVNANPRPDDAYKHFDKTIDEKTTPTNDNDVIAWEADTGGTNERITNDVWTCANQATEFRNVLDDILLTASSSTYGTIYSSFFFDDQTPSGGVISGNYVTGATRNPLEFLVFVMVDEIANNTNPTYPEFSWNEMMGILHDTFQVYWYIDSVQNRVRIEHIRWWEDIFINNLIDLTAFE